jgi:predicted GIY-YIG superfamily endonuclease
METVFIYTLSDPRDNLIKYVGKTINLKRRFSEHLKESGNYKKPRWIQKLSKISSVSAMARSFLFYKK